MFVLLAEGFEGTEEWNDDVENESEEKIFLPLSSLSSLLSSLTSPLSCETSLLSISLNYGMYYLKDKFFLR